MLLFDLFHLRVKLLHLLHGFEALHGEGKEDDIKKYRKKYYGEPPAAHYRVEEPHDGYHADADRPEEPVVHGRGESVAEFFQYRRVARPGVEYELVVDEGARLYGNVARVYPHDQLAIFIYAVELAPGGGERLQDE